MLFYYKLVSGFAVITERLEEKYFESFGRLFIHLLRPVVCSLYTVTNPILPIQYKIRDCHRKIVSIIGHNYKRSRRFARNLSINLTDYQKVLEEECKKNGDQVDDWIFNIKNRKVLDEIFYFTESNLREITETPFGEIIKSFLRYVKEQSRILEKLWDQKVEYPEELVKKFPDLVEYAGYADAIYGFSRRKKCNEKGKKQECKNKKDFIEFANVPEENIIYNTGTSCMYRQANAVILSHEKKSIFIVIRGTESVFDCVADIDSKYTDITIGKITGKVHTGILKSAENLSFDIRDKVLNHLKKYPTYEIVLIGHSLGAGCGSLLALLWLNDEEMKKYSIKCYAYAPPSVISSNLNILLKGIVLSCINGDDIVPRLSFGSLMDLKNIILYIYRNDLDQEFGNFYENFKEECNNEKLCPPGDIMQIFHEYEAQYTNLTTGNVYEDNEKSAFIPGFVGNEYYGTILFSRTMVGNHRMGNYLKNLNFIMQKLWNGHGFN
ncbi:hypothetical protein SteCoe_18856 [Stentor coeruleus]|uniref:sn-1-specific diacylglycerol lipase n=1 Tax=Stentor coeruleus TaxID=5963 RepID=A0A1R2BVE8_9CILI|nr:hypothetical protein SteCoe_18856 [Stentor coeruleus]